MIKSRKIIFFLMLVFFIRVPAFAGYPEQRLGSLMDEGIGTANLIVESIFDETAESIYDSISESIYNDTNINGYGRFIDVVAGINPIAQYRLFTYYNDWQFSGMRQDFFSYSANRAEKEIRYLPDYDAVACKFLIGAAVISFPWLISYLIPGAVKLHASLLIISRTSARFAIGGASLGFMTSSLAAGIKGQSFDDAAYSVIKNTADCFLFASISGAVQGSFYSLKNISGASIVNNKIFNQKNKLVWDSNGRNIGRTIRFEGVTNSDDIYFVGKNSIDVYDINGVRTARIAKIKNTYVLYRGMNNRLVGYLDNSGNLVAYDDPYSLALIKGQNRVQPGFDTRRKVQEFAKSSGLFNSETGHFLDAIDGSEIIGTPEMGHTYGNEYINSLQRAYAKGLSEAQFRISMKNPQIYQLESINGNRSHFREASTISIDAFDEVSKQIGEELWTAL